MGVGELVLGQVMCGPGNSRGILHKSENAFLATVGEPFE